MRLQQFEIDNIKQMAQTYFGKEAVIYLFGSRTDNSKRGGDIDLFISQSEQSNYTLENKINFLAELKSIIGDQKIDVVFDNENTRKKTNFHQSIKNQNIAL